MHPCILVVSAVVCGAHCSSQCFTSLFAWSISKKPFNAEPRQSKTHISTRKYVSNLRLKPQDTRGQPQEQGDSGMQLSRAHGDLYRGCLEMVSVRFSLQLLTFLGGKAAVCGVL